jgi:hypothetical protein
MIVAMANQSSDRQRMRNDFRELAKLAKPVSGSPMHGFDTADSSGYVDLSAYSTRDPAWVDRELARARKGAPPPLPRAASQAIEVLTPQSLAPVSLEAFGEPEDTMSTRPSRGRRGLTAIMSLAAVAAVGFLAFTLANHPPPAADVHATIAAAAVAPPATPDPTPQPAETSPAATPATVAAPPLAPTTTAPTTAVAAASPATSTPKKTTTRAVRAHGVAAAPAVAPARAAAAVPAVVIPKSKPAAGSDSLMDLIKKSVATGK